MLNDILQAFQVTFLGNLQHLFVAAMVTVLASEGAAWAGC